MVYAMSDIVIAQIATGFFTMVTAVSATVGAVMIAKVNTQQKKDSVKVDEVKRIQEITARRTESKMDAQALVLDEHTALMKAAHAAGNSMMRVQLQLVADLTRDRANENPDNAAYVAAADLAEKMLVEHDERQASITAMSSDSLRAYIDKDRDQPPPSDAQAIADRALDQQIAVRDYGRLQAGQTSIPDPPET